MNKESQESRVKNQEMDHLQIDKMELAIHVLVKSINCCPGSCFLTLDSQKI